MGAFLLAEAGLLNGRQTTAHWKFSQELAKRYPKVKVVPEPVWVKDGNIYTSAGISAGIDLALAWVEEDCGNRVAAEVARELVLFLRRPGGQAQLSVSLAAQPDEMKSIAVACFPHLALLGCRLVVCRERQEDFEEGLFQKNTHLVFTPLSFSFSRTQVSRLCHS